MRRVEGKSHHSSQFEEMGMCLCRILQVCKRDMGHRTWAEGQSGLKTPYVLPYGFLSAVNTEMLYLCHSVWYEI